MSHQLPTCPSCQRSWHPSGRRSGRLDPSFAAMASMMALGPRLDLRQSQSLVMTPQLQQAIRLLALSQPRGRELHRRGDREEPPARTTRRRRRGRAGRPSPSSRTRRFRRRTPCPRSTPAAARRRSTSTRTARISTRTAPPMRCTAFDGGDRRARRRRTPPHDPRRLLRHGRYHHRDRTSASPIRPRRHLPPRPNQDPNRIRPHGPRASIHRPRRGARRQAAGLAPARTSRSNASFLRNLRFGLLDEAALGIEQGGAVMTKTADGASRACLPVPGYCRAVPASPGGSRPWHAAVARHW